MAASIHPEYIYIEREKQLERIDTAIQAWKSSCTAQTGIGEEQPYCIVWLWGNAGIGKSTILKKYHGQISSTSLFPEAKEILVGNIIDWSRILAKAYTSLAFMHQGIENIHYYELLHISISQALHKPLEAFQAYADARQTLHLFSHEMGTLARNFFQEDTQHLTIKEFRDVKNIPDEKLVALLRWYATTGILRQDAQEIQQQVTELIGEEIQLENAFLPDFYRVASHKIGPRFHDYLQTENFLGTALGNDLQIFSQKKPLLLFFDTYEYIAEDSHLLRTVMEAAGSSVGWCICGRTPPWSATETNHAPTAINQPQLDARFVDALVQLELDQEGRFSPADIFKYFKQIHQQQRALPALKRQEAHIIWQITQGIPYAVRHAAILYAQRGRIETIIEDNTAVQKITSDMIRQYLRYMTGTKKERITLYGLAQLRRPENWQIVGELLGTLPDQDIPIEKRLRVLLQTSYSVFIEDEHISFHPEMRIFLRSRLLMQPTNTEKQEVATLIQTSLQKVLHTLEADHFQDTDNTLRDRFEDDDWIDAYMDLIEARFWVDNALGLYCCLPFLLAAWIYRRDLIEKILVLGNFFVTEMNSLHTQWWLNIKQGFQQNGSLSIESKEQSLTQLKHFLQVAAKRIPTSLAQYQQELFGALDWRRAEIHRTQQKEQAFYWYQRACEQIHGSKMLRREAAYTGYELARNLYEMKDYQQCLALSKKILTIAHDFADANYLRGNVYYTKRDYHLAIIEYQYALALNKEHIFAQSKLGDSYFHASEYRQASASYSAALALASSNAVLYYNRAVAVSADGTEDGYDRALADYNAAINVQPQFAWAYLNRAHIYGHLRHNQAARADYKRAFQLTPSDIQVAWMMMWAHLTARSSLDLTRIAAIAALEPNDYLAHVCRAICLAFQPDVSPSASAAALHEIDQALVLDRTQYDPYFWQGMIYAYQGDTANAQIAIEQALERHLPPMLLSPLRWLEAIQPQFFERYLSIISTNVDL